MFHSDASLMPENGQEPFKCYQDTRDISDSKSKVGQEQETEAWLKLGMDRTVTRGDKNHRATLLFD